MKPGLVQRPLVYLGALVVLVAMGFPLYGLVLTSVQREEDIRSRDVGFIPRYIESSHYGEVLGPGHIVQIEEAMTNSLILSVLTAVLTVAIAVPASYALVRLRLPGKRYFLAALFSVYLFPTLLFVMPLYITAVRIGLVDTFAGLLVPYLAFLLPFSVWILASFMRRVPVELEEAARLDGANQLGVFRYVVLPLVSPGILAALLMGFILAWVEFLTPLLFTGELKILTVALGLYRSSFDIQVGQLAAAAVLTALPVILITVVFQQTIRRVITAGAER